MRRASSAQLAAEQPRRRRVGQHEEQRVAIRLGHAAQGEDLVGRLVPGQHVPAPAGDIGRMRQALDQVPDRLRHDLRGEGALVAMAGERSADDCARLLPSFSARARASMVISDGLTSRPCSSRTYQSTPMPASSATSSRRRPGVRRRRVAGRPTVSGRSRCRRERRKSPSSLRRASMVVPLNPRIIPGLNNRTAPAAEWAIPKTR